MLRLLAKHHVELYDTGREATIRATFAQLAPETTEGDLATLLDLGLVPAADQPDGVPRLRRPGEPGGRPTARSPTTPLLSKLDSLTSISCLIRGDWTTAAERARRGLGRLEAWWEDPIGRTGWNNVGRAIALSERWHDSDDEVRELSVTLRREPNRLVVLEATRALGDAMAGRPVDALRVAAGVRTSAALANLVMSRAELGLAEAIAHRELADDAAWPTSSRRWWPSRSSR